MASKLVSIIVFVFDVIAFGLAVAAEQRRSTVCFFAGFISLSVLFGYNICDGTRILK